MEQEESILSRVILLCDRQRMSPPTSLRAEPEGLVAVIVFSGGTPAVTIIPARSGAAVILLSLEVEGEFTGSALRVAAQGEEHCKTKIEKCYRESLNISHGTYLTFIQRSHT